MIIFLLPCFSGGGAERVTINILTELFNRGYSVGIIVFNKSGPLLSIIPNKIPIYDLETHTLKYSIFPLVKKIRELNPKVIFSTLGYINVTLLSIRWLLSREVEIWVREANLPSISLPNNNYYILMTTLYRFLYGKSNKMICTSTRMKNEFVSDFLVPEDIIEILPNPVDVDLIRSSSLLVKRFDNGGACYVASGRLTFQKGFDNLLKWFSILDDKLSTLVILGSGNDKSLLINQSSNLNLQNRVKFIDFCSNPWQWYAGADVFLLSSRWEGLPNVVLESLACGTPVIATSESGGIDEIAKQVKHNELVVTYSSLDFINEMSKIKPNPVKKIKKSLLPEIYSIKFSVSIFEKLMNN